MGVHGLWPLLEPVGRRINIEAITNKRLAVGARRREAGGMQGRCASCAARTGCRSNLPACAGPGWQGRTTRRAHARRVAEQRGQRRRAVRPGAPTRSCSWPLPRLPGLPGRRLKRPPKPGPKHGAPTPSTCTPRRVHLAVPVHPRHAGRARRPAAQRPPAGVLPAHMQARGSGRGRGRGDAGRKRGAAASARAGRPAAHLRRRAGPAARPPSATPPTQPLTPRPLTHAPPLHPPGCCSTRCAPSSFSTAPRPRSSA